MDVNVLHSSSIQQRAGRNSEFVLLAAACSDEPTSRVSNSVLVCTTLSTCLELMLNLLATHISQVNPSPPPHRGYISHQISRAGSVDCSMTELNRIIARSHMQAQFNTLTAVKFAFECLTAQKANSTPCMPSH